MRFLILFTFIFINNSYAIEWSEGITEIANNNAELLAAKKNLESSQYLETAAYSGFLPKVSAGAGTNHSNTAKTNSLSVNATENLFSGFLDSSKINEAKLTTIGTQENLKSIIAKVSYDYKSAFMSLIYAQKYIILTNDIIKRREANLRLVELRFESGRENIGSLHLSKAYLAQAKYDHLIATNALSVAQANLAKVLGRSSYEDLSVTGIVPVKNLNNIKLNFLDLAVITPEYKKAVTDEKIAMSFLDIVNANFYPSLNLTGNGTRANRDGGAWSNTWSVGADITFPLFNGGKDYFTSKSSHELYRSAVFFKRNIQENGIVKLKDAYARYLESISKLEVDQAFVEAGNSRERIAKEKYNNGLLTFDEWDIIENDLINRQKSLLQSERDRVVAEANWEQVQGMGVL
jgi:outer membrane protein TolC